MESAQSTLERLVAQGALRDGAVWHAEQQFQGRPWRAVAIRALPFSAAEIDGELPWGGLPYGALHEFSAGPSTVGLGALPPILIPGLLATRALHESARVGERRSVFWIGSRCWPTPHLLTQTLPPELRERCIFIDPPSRKQRMWAIETALRSRATAAVVAECGEISFIASRRLSLAAEHGGGVGILLSSAARGECRMPSAAVTRWQIASWLSPTLSPRFVLSLISSKGRKPLRTEWQVEVAYGEDQEEVSLRVPSDVAVRSNREARCEGARERRMATG